MKKTSTLALWLSLIGFLQADVSFSLDGEFFVPEPGKEIKTWDFPVSEGRIFQKIVVELEVTPGDWWAKNPDGLHNLFWLTRGGIWRSSTVGYVNLFGEGRGELKQMTNLGLKKGEAQNRLSDYQPTKGTPFHLSYTYDCWARTITSVISENGVEKARAEMATTTHHIQSQGGFYQFWIGLEDKYNECPTYGWTYANLKIRMEDFEYPSRLRSGQPLTVHKDNPRYFDSGNGKALVLCGVNHGWELQDHGWSTPYTLDWLGFLDYLQNYHLNYIRLWRTESTIGRESTDTLTTPMPYQREGPGLAHDKHPTFNLDKFNQAYFDRMRQRCLDARLRGMYVSIMFFEKHSTFNQRSDGGREFPWKAHPFHPDNNINGLNPDINGDGTPVEIHHLPGEQSDPQKRAQAAKTLAYQKAYIRKVVDTVSDLDNVIFEVCNEALPDDATDRWQAHLAEYFNAYQKTKPNRHLIGFTGPAKYWLDDPWPDMEEQKIESVAFVSPREVDLYRNNPPINEGEKIVFADSDHIYPYGRDHIWVWKSFLRGLHPQALESYGVIPENPPRIDFKRDELVRKALGQCLSYAAKMNLVQMEPRLDVSSTGYCLAHPGHEYLAFSPEGREITIQFESDLSDYTIEWLNVERDEVLQEQGNSTNTLKPPFKGPAVAYLKKQSGS